MLTRRGFLLLLGAAAGGAGLWLPATGLVTMPRAMVLGLAGDCSLCDKPADEVGAVAGILGRQARICDECALFSAEIFDDHRDPPGGEARPKPDARAAEETRRVEGDLQVALARLRRTSVMMATTPSGELTYEMASEHGAASRDVATLLGMNSEPAQRIGGFELEGMRLCSFCDAEADELLTGRCAKICDRCVRDAANLMVTHLRV